MTLPNIRIHAYTYDWGPLIKYLLFLLFLGFCCFLVYEFIGNEPDRWSDPRVWEFYHRTGRPPIRIP